MIHAILVVNAGSSSIKFSVFHTGNSGLTAKLCGQIEGLFTSQHFVAKNTESAVVAERSWGEGVKLGHEGAIEHLRVFLTEQSGGVPLTAGIGENAVSIRKRVCDAADWLGVKLDPVANRNPGKSGWITTPRSRVAAWVLATNEELMIARHTLRVTSQSKAAIQSGSTQRRKGSEDAKWTKPCGNQAT